MHLAAQIEELRAQGSTVETIFPDSESEHLFGVNGMDLSLRPPAARAGYDQGSGSRRATRGILGLGLREPHMLAP